MFSLYSDTVSVIEALVSFFMVMLFLCILLPLTAVVFKYRAFQIKKEFFQKKYGNLVSEIIVNDRRRSTLSFWPLFFIRRYIFVLIPSLFLTDFPALQIMSWTFVSSLYTIQYAFIRPHEKPSRQHLEIFHEIILMFINYHLFLMTQFNKEDKAIVYVGFSFIGLVVVVFVVNIIILFYQSISLFYRKRHLKY